MSGKSQNNLERKQLKLYSKTIAAYYKEVRKSKEFGGIIDRALKGQISSAALLKELPLVDETNQDIAKMFLIILVNHGDAALRALRSDTVLVKITHTTQQKTFFNTKHIVSSIQKDVATNVVLKYILDTRLNDNFIQLKTAVAPGEFITFLVNTFHDLTREALVTCKTMMKHHGAKKDSKDASQNAVCDMGPYIRARHRILEALNINSFWKVFSGPYYEKTYYEKMATAEVNYVFSWYLQQIDKAKSKETLAELEDRIENIDILTGLAPVVEKKDIPSILNGEKYLGKSIFYARLMEAIFTRSCDPSLIDDTAPISNSSTSDLPAEASANSSSSSVTTQTPFSAALEENVLLPKKEPAVPLASAPISTPTLADVNKHVQLAKMEASHKHAVAGLELLKNLASIYFRGALITSTEYYRGLEQLAPYENRWLGEKEWHELRDIQEMWENAVRSRPRPSGLETSATVTSQPNLEGLSKTEDKSQQEETAFVGIPFPTESTHSFSSNPLVSSSTTSALDYDDSSHAEMAFNTEGIQEAEEITETDDIDLQEHQSHQPHSHLSASTAYMIASMAVEGNPSNEENFGVKGESKSSKEEADIQPQQHAVSTPSASFLAPPKNVNEFQQSASQLATNKGEGEEHEELPEPGGLVIVTPLITH